MGLINKAREQERDERFYRQWVAYLPFMGAENFISFEEYKEQLTGANIDTRPTAVIMAELDEIEAEMRGGAENGS